MNKKGFLDFDMEFDSGTVIALIAGVLGGFISLIVSSTSPVKNPFMSMITFAVTAVVCFFLVYFISNR